MTADEAAAAAAAAAAATHLMQLQREQQQVSPAARSACYNSVLQTDRSTEGRYQDREQQKKASTIPYVALAHRRFLVKRTRTY